LPAAGDTLYLIANPNVGTATPVGLTGFTGWSALDIGGPANDAFAVSGTQLVRIDLTTGVGTLVGTIGGGVEIVAFALQL
jgi:hypothetical protein